MRDLALSDPRMRMIWKIPTVAILIILGAASGQSLRRIGGGAGPEIPVKGPTVEFLVSEAGENKSELLRVFEAVRKQEHAGRKGLADYYVVKANHPREFLVQKQVVNLYGALVPDAAKTYLLRTSSDLAADFATWDSVNVPGSVENNGVFEIATSAPLNLHSIVRPGDPVRFYRVEEYPLPPATVFEDNFDGADQGWTTGFDASDIAMNTVWEMGDPFGGPATGPAAANSAPNCYGTNLTTNYGISSNTWLRSPAIDLTTATGATVTFQQWVDMDEI